MIALIAAISNNSVIGNKGKLPWWCPSDLRYFSNITRGHTVLMGRKTYESIGKPLAGRKNIVVGSIKPELSISPQETRFVNDISDIDFSEDLFVIGGRHLYERMIGVADVMYITRILADVDGDTLFPEIDWSVWRPDNSNPPIIKADNDQFQMQFFMYHRISRKTNI